MKIKLKRKTIAHDTGWQWWILNSVESLTEKKSHSERLHNIWRGTTVTVFIFTFPLTFNWSHWARARTYFLLFSFYFFLRSFEIIKIRQQLSVERSNVAYCSIHALVCAIADSIVREARGSFGQKQTLLMNEINWQGNWFQMKDDDPRLDCVCVCVYRNWYLFEC